MKILNLHHHCYFRQISNRNSAFSSISCNNFSSKLLWLGNKNLFKKNWLGFFIRNADKFKSTSRKSKLSWEAYVFCLLISFPGNLQYEKHTLNTPNFSSRLLIHSKNGKHQSQSPKDPEHHEALLHGSCHGGFHSTDDSVWSSNRFQR